MGDFFSYEWIPILLNMSLTASAVILCVLLVRLLLCRAPRVFSYALWAVVLFRLLCPVSLTAGFSLLMQIVMSKGQKAQMELQSVNGQAMMTQKVMMWMMPIMMGLFSLMYTAAFSVYIIVSNIISMLTTLLINKVVDIRFKKALEAQGEEKK